MIATRLGRQLLSALCLCLIAGYASALPLPEGREVEPVVGQEGKDVIWVPTAQALADKMLNLAKVTSQDYVIDLGSGDGRIVITAAKLGARALGIEYNPDLVALARRNAIRAGVSDKVQFVQADLFTSDLSPATVLTMFLLPDINLKLRPALLNLKPGTRIVSNSFDMKEWEPDQTVAVNAGEGCDDSYCQAYLWVVPAAVQGKWKLARGELALKQSFQMLSGTLRADAKRVPIKQGRMDGDEINFMAGNDQYRGRANGDIMQGTFKNARGTFNWQASRVSEVGQTPFNYATGRGIRKH